VTRPGPDDGPPSSTACPFYEDVSDFRQRLKRQARDGRTCWSCSAATPLLVSMNAGEDLANLGVAGAGREDCIDLCPACTAEYMNSFNRLFAEKNGREASPAWTEEMIVRMCWQASHRSEIVH
jgi:hypothetical protein